MNFVEILNEILIIKKLNQTQFAKLLGVKQSQVSEWLNGKSKPGYDNLKAICVSTGVSGDQLLGITPINK